MIAITRLAIFLYKKKTPSDRLGVYWEFFWVTCKVKYYPGVFRTRAHNSLKSPRRLLYRAEHKDDYSTVFCFVNGFLRRKNAKLNPHNFLVLTTYFPKLL